jgi:hypothetical protein
MAFTSQITHPLKKLVYKGVIIKNHLTEEQAINEVNSIIINHGYKPDIVNADGYSYVIIKENYPELARESVLLHNKYKASKKYAFIVKLVNKDHSESIAFIEYSSDLVELSQRAKQFPTWYNYPIGVTKNIQGYLREI